MLEALAAEFRQFAREECHGSSPLYERLASRIADDPELLRLAGHAREGQPVSSPITQQSARRDLFLVSIEWVGAKHPRLRLVSFHVGVATERILARCGGFGAWLKWHAEDGR